MLKGARERARGLYRLLWQAYSGATTLFYGETNLESATGIQQGDPLGPVSYQTRFLPNAVPSEIIFAIPVDLYPDLFNLIPRLMKFGAQVYRMIHTCYHTYDGLCPSCFLYTVMVED